MSPVDQLGADLDDDGAPADLRRRLARRGRDLPLRRALALARGALDDAAAIRVAERADYAAPGGLRDGRLVATHGTGLAPLGLLADLADVGRAPGSSVQDGSALTGTLAGGLASG